MVQSLNGKITTNINPVERNGGVPVNLQDQTTPLFDFYFVRSLAAPTTLSIDAVEDAYTITVTSAAGFVVGSYMGMFGGGRYYFGTVLNVAANVLTLDSPIDFAFTAGSTVARLSRSLNVNGSVTPVTFSISGPTAGGIEFDLTRFMLAIETATAPSLPNFGDLAALTNGLVLRKNDGIKRNIWNIKRNLDFGVHAYDLQLLSAVGPGADGILVRYSFSGQDKHGVTVRLAAGDTLDLVVQDDLTGLTDFIALAEGHEVTD